MKKWPKLLEAAYPGNLGAVEMFQFYQKANDKQIKEMELAAKNDDWDQFKKLIKKVLDISLI